MFKKILFFVSSMNKGGAERVAANLTNAWAEQGHKVTLVVTYSKRGDCFYQLSNKTNLIYLADLTDKGQKNNPFHQIKRLLALRHLIKTTQPDVMISFLTNVNVAALIASVWSGYSLIICERNYPPLQPVSRVYEYLRKLTYPLAHSLVMQTGIGLQWANSNFPKIKSIVIPNPVSYPLRDSEPKLALNNSIADDRKLLLSAGRLVEVKGFDRCIGAFATLAEKHSDWDLIILGEGPLRKVLESQIRDLGLTDRVYLPGNAGNMSEWYARANLYVMSSMTEGFPNALVESMAHGCAVVSYDCKTGPRDIIRDGVNGLLVNPVGDIPALASALDQLMANDMLREQMEEDAKEVRERYSFNNIMSMWDSLFNQVTKKTR
ncbi:MAG TPA: glycosyltransferase family 4 protein [Nitrosomonas sp.]|nr:glycosyltransferase family 4 protein [Nitrosomonas sp.]HQX14155.1 glycosyltransferase family 4 protein [Nitrosomonas sp.]HRB20287.1 glycosyltransferase family 4 protein [Nitrosomonas sp.]HRB32126.1 glycosyltransferase family 4 protein [Nitrosomonas sp.]HRB45784.1 glycosyltransferase family 4 protein [Nitrosomonas sp.]